MGEIWFQFIKGMLVVVLAFLYPFLYISGVIFGLYYLGKLFGIE